MNISNYNPTIVTMFYNIREKESNNVISNKSINNNASTYYDFIVNKS